MGALLRETTLKDDDKTKEIANKKSEKRKNRGMMQWKPVRVSFICIGL